MEEYTINIEPTPNGYRMMKRVFQDTLENARPKRFIAEKLQNIMGDYDIQEGFTTSLRTTFETEDLLPLSEVDEVSGFPILSDIIEEALIRGLESLVKEEEERIASMQQAIAELERCGY